MYLNSSLISTQQVWGLLGVCDKPSFIFPFRIQDIDSLSFAYHIFSTQASCLAIILSDTMSSASILSTLTRLSIAYQHFEHPALYTVQDIDKFASHVPGLNNKNLFLKDKKTKEFFIVFVPEDKRVDLSALTKQIGVKRLSMASGDSMKSVLGVTEGAVSPLALLLDTDAKVRLLVDQALWNMPEDTLFQCHPLVNTETVVLSRSAIQKFVEDANHKVEVVDVPEGAA